MKLKRFLSSVALLVTLVAGILPVSANNGMAFSTTNVHFVNANTLAVEGGFWLARESRFPYSTNLSKMDIEVTLKTPEGKRTYKETIENVDTQVNKTQTFYIHNVKAVDFTDFDVNIK